jgi:hypothetical protein
MPNIIGDPIPSYVKNQIIQRQSLKGSGISSNRTPKQITALNSPTSWVKLASGVNVDGTRLQKNQLPISFSGASLAQNHVLFGGFSKLSGNQLIQRNSFLETYGPGDNQFGLVPMAGIESISVKHLNNGSIRSAEVKIKAYNKTQFSILDILYMRLGYTMLLEWGNSTYTNNNGTYQTMGPTLVESGFLDGSLSNSSSTEILQKINSFRTSYNGNYDAIYGRISNFNWSFSEDGNYNIELSILSLGDVFESLKINIPASPQELKFSTEASIILTETKPEATGSYLGQPEGIELESSNDSSPTKDKLSTYLFNSKISFANQKVTAPEDIDFKIKGKPIKIGSFVKPSPTITVTPTGSGTPATLNNEASTIQTPKDIAYFFYSNGEAPNPVIPEDLGYYMRLGHLLEYIKEFIIPKVKNSGGKKFPLIELDTTTDNKMYYFPNQISLDPRVCVVNSILREIKLFDTLSPWIGNGYANIMNIYVSFEQIHSSLESNLDEENRVNLYGFLSSICDSLNIALGGVNNLQSIVDEDTNTIRIIDQNYNPNPQPKNHLILYGYEGNQSTFVRNVSLKTALTPELTATIAVGATSDGYSQGIENTMFAKWNKNIKNRFQPKIITPDPKTTPIDPVKNYINNFYAKGKLALGYKYDGSENPPELDKDSIGNNISIATEFYKYAQAYIHSLNQEYGSPTQGFIPINLSITMDGIAGIKIFNSLSVDTSFLPSNYPKSLRFIAKAINHKISNQDWETTLETLVIPETHNGASLIIPFSNLSGQIETLLGANGILSVILDETTGNLNTPSWLTERFAALRTPPGLMGDTGPVDPSQWGGSGLDPLKKLIFSGESSDYDAMYPSTTYKARFKVTSMSQTIAKVASTATGAVGRYQNMPEFILGRARTSGLDPNKDLYNEVNQEKMGEGLIFETTAGPYIKGTNKGTKEDLIKAVQGIGRGWASVPVVIQGVKIGKGWKDGPTVGNVETGAGSKGYYTNAANNGGNIRDKKVADVVIALIKTRQNLAPNSMEGVYIPPYVR